VRRPCLSWTLTASPSRVRVLPHGPTHHRARARTRVLICAACTLADVAVSAVVDAFSSASAPFVAVHVSAPAAAAADASQQRFRGRELRSLSMRSSTTGTGATGPLLFERFSFVSPAIWMGVVALTIIFLILIPAVLCTMDVQTPTQFEKKPLLNTQQ
jgi:hypothetical protein